MKAFDWNSGKTSLVLVVWIPVCLWSCRSTRELVQTRIYAWSCEVWRLRRESSKKRQDVGSISRDFKAERSEARHAEGYHLQQLISETRAKPAGGPPFPFSPFQPSLHNHCLSFRFTFPRHDGDGDVRFNKAPGMSCHVMHSIACEIYVNTTIRSRRAGILALFLSFSRTSRISRRLKSSRSCQD